MPKIKKRLKLNKKIKVQSLPFTNQLKSILRILARNALKVSGTKHCPGKLFHIETTLCIKCVLNTNFLAGATYSL